MNPYETDKLVAEYLLFHYGSATELAPPMEGLESALFYPVRCVSECLDVAALPPDARALDLGCAVGRSTFELARCCKSVLGIDFSRRFIEAAEQIRTAGEMPYRRTDEGELGADLIARRPEIDPARVAFEVGDAMELREGIGEFDVVLAANLIDRLTEPARFLSVLPRLVKPGGQLIITSPYTWLEEFTPRANWIGGFMHEGMRVSTITGLRAALDSDFDLVTVKDLPFLIREHSRKFQLSLAQASVWRRSHGH